MAFTIYGTQTGAGAQYTQTPWAAEYTGPDMGQSVYIIHDENGMDVNGNGNGGQTVAMQGLPDNFFGFVMLMMGL